MTLIFLAEFLPTLVTFMERLTPRAPDIFAFDISASEGFAPGAVIAGQIGLAGLLGLMFGSFIATLTVRWPRGESIVAGRSRCDSCHRGLALRDMIPLVSYFWMRGTCRTCAMVIDPIHPLAEGLGLAIGLAALALSPTSSGWAHAVFGWMLLPLMLLDARFYWLPDRLVAPLAVVGLVVGGGMLDTDIATRLGGAMVGGLSLAVLAAGFEKIRGAPAMGGGDPKLAAALGAWLGWQLIPMVFLLSSAAGIIWALVHILYQKHRLGNEGSSGEGNGVGNEDVAIRNHRVAFGVFLCGVGWLLVAL